jgi:Tfp pilus assembly protein PilO
MNSHTREQLLVIVAIAAAVLWAGDRFILSPAAAAWTSRSERIVQLKKQVNDGNAVLQREAAIRARWNNMLTNTVDRENSAAEDQVLRAFDRWSRESRVGVTSVQPQWRRGQDDYATLDCRVDAIGNLASITRFIYEIEKDPLGFKVDNVEITARDDRGEQLTLALQVSALQLNLPERK